MAKGALVWGLAIALSVYMINTRLLICYDFLMGLVWLLNDLVMSSHGLLDDLINLQLV